MKILAQVLNNRSSLYKVCKSIPLLSAFTLSLLFSRVSFSKYEEQWLNLIATTPISKTEQISVDHVRRDFAEYYTQKNLELYRLSYGKTYNHWHLIFGGAYLDLESGTTERRLFQMASRQIHLNPDLNVIFRLGLEERLFNSDSQLYFRFRARALINLFARSAFGPTLYNEFFLIPQGSQRFSSALNENRLGLGLRYQWSKVSFFLYNTLSYQKTPQFKSYPQWIQLQVLYNF